MGLGEIGMFLPAESAYGTPGAYSEALRAEATKRATYLSEMDQFYSQLEESQRQFDETLAFQQESWEEEFAYQKKMGLFEMMLGMYQAKTARLGARSSGGMNYLGGSDEKLDFLREMWADKMSGEEETTSSARYGVDYDPYESSSSYDYSHYSDYL